MNDKLEIDRIAFLGRTFSEYKDMFGLDETSLRDGPVLDCPAGPGSFAAEAASMGIDVTACDIMYGLSAHQLRKKGSDDIEYVFDKFDSVSHLYVWKYYRCKDEVINLRKMALERFLGDFGPGMKAGRYIRAELPILPFADRAFETVLSGNFLFLYGDRMDPGFHVSCLSELYRVCSKEVRVFPLCGLDAKSYQHLDYVISRLAQLGARSEILEVPFEFQRGTNRMLRITK